MGEGRAYLQLPLRVGIGEWVRIAGRTEEEVVLGEKTWTARIPARGRIRFREVAVEVLHASEIFWPVYPVGGGETPARHRLGGLARLTGRAGGDGSAAPVAVLRMRVFPGDFVGARFRWEGG